MDLVMMMSEVYNAPHLKNLYCLNHCPLGKEQSISAKIKTLEEVTVSIVAKLDEDNVNDMKRQLLEIAEDGEVSSEEEDDFKEVAMALDKLAVAISELKLIKQRLLRKG